VAAARELHAHAVLLALEATVRHGAEAAVVARVAQGAVQQGEDRARACFVLGRGAQRVARKCGDRRRLRALAAHVADQRRHVGADREEVVEVAAHLDPLARGDEADRRGQPRHRRQAGREQRALEHLGDVALAAVGL
jgi:hypothetical protein